MLLKINQLFQRTRLISIPLKVFSKWRNLQLCCWQGYISIILWTVEKSERMSVIAFELCFCSYDNLVSS